MKRTLTIISVMALLTSSACSLIQYAKIQKFDDEFKNTRKTIARMYLKPDERKTEVGAAKIILEREISDNMTVTNAYFVISRASSSFKVDKSGFLKADGQTFELSIEPVTEFKHRNETSVSTYARTDSTGVTTGQTMDTNEYSWFDDKFMFRLTPELISAINGSDEFIVRFYFGPIPATYKVKGADMRHVRMVLND